MTRPDYILRSDCVTTAICRHANTLITGTEEGNVQIFDTEIMRPTSTWLAHKGKLSFSVIVYSKTLIYCALIYRKPWFTAAISFLPNLIFLTICWVYRHLIKSLNFIHTSIFKLVFNEINMIWAVTMLVYKGDIT